MFGEQSSQLSFVSLPVNRAEVMVGPSGGTEDEPPGQQNTTGQGNCMGRHCHSPAVTTPHDHVQLKERRSARHHGNTSGFKPRQEGGECGERGQSPEVRKQEIMN